MILIFLAICACSAGAPKDVFDHYRGLDIQLLKELDVKYICDLMVERKKVKLGML
jgi:myotubularin-related protein 14